MNDRSSEYDCKNHRRQILSEEEYSSTLQKIITRDYFPSLTSLNRDASILQKRSEGDIAGAVAIRRAARDIAQHEALEQSIEREEEREAVGRGNVRKRPRPLKEESVDGFHMRVTSEDNADFEETMKLEVQAKEQEMDLVYNYHHHHHPYNHHQNASNRRLRLEHGHTEWKRLSHDEQQQQQQQQQQHMNSRLNPSPLLASDEFMPRSTSRTCSTIQTMGTTQSTPTTQTIQTSKTTNSRMMGGASFRNALFFTPNSLQQDTTNAHTSNTSTWNPSLLTNHHDTHNNNSKNIMPPPVFDPKSGESSLPSQLIPYEYKAKPTELSKEKRIIPSNTRFLYQNESRLITCMDHNQPSLEDEYRRGPTHSNTTLRQRSSLDVLNYDTESSNATTDLDDISISSNTIQREREARRHKLEKERNSYVNMTPIILPGQGRDTSPLMTFGNIASTPLVSSLSHSHDSYNNTFFIPNEDSKEKMAQTAQLQLKQKSERFQSTSGSSTNSRLSTSTPRMDRHKSLTPAAQVLLQRRCTTPSSSSSVSLVRDKNSHSRPTSSTSSSLSTSSSARMSSAFASALRHSYTPTHTKKKDRHNTKKDPKNKSLMHVYKATPLNDAMREKDVGKSSIPHTDTTSNTIITETTRGLLKL